MRCGNAAVRFATEAEGTKLATSLDFRCVADVQSKTGDRWRWRTSATVPAFAYLFYRFFPDFFCAIFSSFSPAYRFHRIFWRHCHYFQLTLTMSTYFLSMMTDFFSFTNFRSFQPVFVKISKVLFFFLHDGDRMFNRNIVSAIFLVGSPTSRKFHRE